MKKNKILFSFLSLALLFFVISNVKSAGYDFYVNKDYEGEEKGTSENPFKTIEKALEKAQEKSKILVKNGTYEEQLVLKNGIEIYGEEKSKTIIKGKNGSTIRGNDNNVIKNITILGGSSGIVFEKKGKIQNCIIKNVRKNAIEALAGNSELEITNSQITGSGKGAYIQSGRFVTIEKNKFFKNREEGIDLREKIKGTIHNNQIFENGEGGIEIIVGSSDVSIKNNLIKKNKSSGIATQFYSHAKKTGTIEIKNNTIANNGNYGIVCKAPSGGNPSKDYWNNSIEVTENNIERNKLKSISSSCKIIEAITEEEEKKNQTIEGDVTKEEANQENYDEEINKNEELSLISEKEIILNNLLNEISISHEISTEKIKGEIEKIKKESKIKVFFFGISYKKIKSVKILLEKIREDKLLLEKSISEIGDESPSNSTKDAIEKKEEIERILNSSELFLQEKENKFSLFGWILRSFQEKEIINQTTQKTIFPSDKP